MGRRERCPWPALQPTSGRTSLQCQGTEFYEFSNTGQPTPLTGSPVSVVIPLPPPDCEEGRSSGSSMAQCPCSQSHLLPVCAEVPRATSMSERDCDPLPGHGSTLRCTLHSRVVVPVEPGTLRHYGSGQQPQGTGSPMGLSTQFLCI